MDADVPESSLLITRNLGKTYGQLTALHQCSLEVARGEVFGLLGPNGAGKTTLIRLLLGFLRPTSGSAQIAGFDCARQSPEVRRRVAYLPGDARLFRMMRGRGILKFFTDVRQGSLEAAERYAERLDLDLGRTVAFMSTGMRQKLALAAVLAADTPLVILDEPTSNLDPNVRQTVAQLVRECRDQGRTVVFSSHVLSEVEETCDRVAILRRGHLVHVQELGTLRRRQRIHALLRGPLPEPPAALRVDLDIERHPQPDAGAERLIVETSLDLAKLLPWLAAAPLENLRVEQVGLRSVYETYHGVGEGGSGKPISPPAVSSPPAIPSTPATPSTEPSARGESR